MVLTPTFLGLVATRGSATNLKFPFHSGVPTMRKLTTISVAACALGSGAAADMTQIGLDSYSITASDFDGAAITVNVVDMYMLSDDNADVLLNIYNLVLPGSAQLTFYQSITGAGWAPNNLGGPFDTEATRVADSFVSIGGVDFDVPEQSAGAGAGTALDPSFGGSNADFPNELGGWFNSNPPSLIGQVGETKLGLGVFIGRFSSTQALGIENFVGPSLEATWNQGLGTPGIQDQFSVIPAPGAVALLALAGLVSAPRRR